MAIGEHDNTASSDNNDLAEMLLANLEHFGQPGADEKAYRERFAESLRLAELNKDMVPTVRASKKK